MLSCPSSAARHVEPGECRGCGGGAGRAPRPCARPARRRLRSPRAAPASAGEASGGDEPLAPRSFGPLDEGGLPTQGRAVVRGTALAERSDPGGDSLAYLSELLAIQQGSPRNIGFFGTRNMGLLYQQLIEILSYAMENHIFTSGATGTNAAVIRGALRAERKDLLTVLSRQSAESQELLAKVTNVVEMPQNDGLPLAEASRICNEDIVRRVQQVICFAFHDSKLLLDTCAHAKATRKMVVLLYMD